MVRRLEDLVAFQFAETFAAEVHKLIEASPRATRDWKFREQLEDAASGVERSIAEGFGRFRPTEFAQFLRYALASLAEATTCLRQGVQRGYFTESSSEPAFTWGRRCKEVTLKLLVSQVRRSRAEKDAKRIPNRSQPNARERPAPRLRKHRG